jgi:two-component system chemotaxis response regulator CheB
MLTPENAELLRSRSALIVGASSGAVAALNQLLPVVPQASRIPIVIVVHLPPNRPSLLPEIFAPRCAALVREAEDREAVFAGTVWFAPANYHLLIERERTFSLSVDEPVNFSRPSIDVLFESAAECFGDGLCAIVLTGANDDGALGAHAVRRDGGLVIVQDPSTASAPQMPQAALSKCNPQIVATLPEIADFIYLATRPGP